MKLLASVNVNVTGMTIDQEQKVINAADDILQFFRSEFFRTKLLSTNTHVLRGESSSSISKRLDDGQLYSLFMAGEEEWNNLTDNQIDLNVVRYFKWWSKVKGYIIPMKQDIHVNGKFFDTSSVMKIGSNLAHEWSHTLGLRHSGPHLKESIPYLINEWFCEWYTTVAENQPVIHPDNYVLEYRRSWWTLGLFKTWYRRVE